MPDSTKVAQRPDIEYIRVHRMATLFERNLCDYATRLEQVLRDVLREVQFVGRTETPERLHEIQRIIREVGIKL